MSIIVSVLVLAFLAYSFVMMRRSDARRLRHALADVPGEIISTKLVSLGSSFGKGQPRTYRVVLQLASGARLLHRIELREDGSAQRTL